MARIWLKRVGNMLYPDGDDSIEALSLLPFDKILRGDIDQPRNVKHLRLYWKLCDRIGKGIGKDAEFVDRAFKIETGYFQHYTLADGRECLVLGSISFHKMTDQTKFDAFWRDCMDIMFRKWGIAEASVADLLRDKRYD